MILRTCEYVESGKLSGMLLSIQDQHDLRDFGDSFRSLFLDLENSEFVGDSLSPGPRDVAQNFAVENDVVAGLQELRGGFLQGRHPWKIDSTKTFFLAIKLF